MQWTVGELIIAKTATSAYAEPFPHSHRLLPQVNPLL